MSPEAIRAIVEERDRAIAERDAAREDLARMRGADLVGHLMQRFHLTPRLACCLAALVTPAEGHIVRATYLRLALEAGGFAGDVEAMKVAICQLRRRVPALRDAIRAVYGLGYRLDPVARAAVRADVDPWAHGPQMPHDDPASAELEPSP